MNEGWHLVLLKTEAAKVSCVVRQTWVVSKQLD